MDNLLYISTTNIISLISLIGTVIIITAFIIKKEIKAVNIVLFLIFLVGMYLYIPLKLTSFGFLYQNPKYLKLAGKLSINPYERRLCNKYLSELYADDIYYQGLKDGSKAINYMEWAIKGDYKKYPNETKKLMFWYSIKGDEEKTFMLADILEIKTGIAIRNIYIMKDDYKKVLDTFENDKGVENYLKADIYKKLGNTEAAKNARNIADETYNSTLSHIKIRAKKLEYKENIEKYKSIENYKNWILASRKEYGF